MAAEELLASLVRIPSVTGNEAECVEFLYRWLLDQGLPAERVGANLKLKLGSGGPRLLLCTHLDTVPPASGWTVDPHAAEWNNGKLIGLGSNDAKGCATAMAIAALDMTREGCEVVIAWTVEEETGGPNGIQAFLREEEPFDAALVGEPTSLRACLAQRGMLMVKCIAHGTPGHVAHGGDNAIHKAARDITMLEARRFPRDPILGETRCQVVTVAGGRARNQIPDVCEFYVDLRTTPNLSHDVILAEFRGELESEVDVHSERYRPCSTERDTLIAQCAIRHASTPEPVGSPTVSDWAFLPRIPAVKIGPGDTKRSHTADEYLLADELHAGIRFYRDCVQTYREEATRALG